LPNDFLKKTMTDCIFCKIAAGKIPADIVYQNDNVVVFKDLSPQAPVHLLAIPRQHISTINDLKASDANSMGQLFLAAKEVASDAGLGESGYRTVMNCGEGAGQSVFHVHLHILGGRALTWPPG
jgi:histidine triad (HIT) family protein